MTKKNIAEQFSVPAQDINGGGEYTIEPTETGDSSRPQDNQDPADKDVAIVPGVGELSRAETLKGLLTKLATLPPEILDRIANEFDANTDYNTNPSGATDGLQGQNLASISVKEDVAEMFGDETLSEEFKGKAEVILEAHLAARMVVLEAEMEEKYEARIVEEIDNVTEELVSKIDRYISFVAEQFVEENKPVLEATVKTTIAEQFMTGVIELANKFNINITEGEVDVVEGLQTTITDLETKLNESLEEKVTLKEQVDALKRQDVLDTVAEGLTDTQKAKLDTLVEHVEASDLAEFTQKVTILRESVSSVAAKVPETKISQVLTESVQDGVPVLEDEIVVSTRDPVVSRTLSALGRTVK